MTGLWLLLLASAVTALAVLLWRISGEAQPYSHLLTPEGRRGWALVLLAGGGLAMTVYAGAALWIVRDRPQLAFSLGAGALFLIAIVLTGFAGLLVKRTVRASGMGASFEATDEGMPPGAIEGAAAGAAAGTVAGAAAAADTAKAEDAE